MQRLFRVYDCSVQVDALLTKKNDLFLPENVKKYLGLSLPVVS